MGGGEGADSQGKDDKATRDKGKEAQLAEPCEE